MSISELAKIIENCESPAIKATLEDIAKALLQDLGRQHAESMTEILDETF